MTTRTGYWLAPGLGPGDVVGWDDRPGDGRVDACPERARRAGGHCAVAHPHAPCPSGGFWRSAVGSSDATPDSVAALARDRVAVPAARPRGGGACGRARARSVRRCGGRCAQRM
ncbi:hypothetical protein [Streptomyces sp. AFD10]|uniref:hypothetical protein n=1 Tax=Streptomyces TaxID=1883 RepID=UPI0034DF00EB